MGFWFAELGRGQSRGTHRGYVSPPSPSGRRLVVAPGSSAPTVYALESCAVVFDGELYEATQQVHETAAAERVLRAYADGGLGSLDRFRGVFAFVVWDWARDIAAWGRDPVGIHPLFHATADDAILCSPSPERLAEEPSLSTRLNLLAVAEHACRGVHEPEETLYQAVSRLRPGHRLEDRAGVRRLVPCWRPQLTGDLADERVAAEAFERSLQTAVARAIGQSRAAILLSGGVDSASVAAAATQYAREEGVPAPVAVSVSLPPPTDESPAQRAITHALGIEHVLVPFDDLCKGSLLLGALRSSAAGWIPATTVMMPLYYGLLEHAKTLGCEVVISGDGGNQWYGVGWPWAADLILGGQLGLLRRFVASQAPYRGHSVTSHVIWNNGLRLIARAAVEPWLRRAAPAAVNAALRRRHERDLPKWGLPDPTLRGALLERRAARPTLRRENGSFARAYRRRIVGEPIASMVFETGAKAGRDIGLQVRFPLYDADLVELLGRIDPTVLQTGGEVKGLPRKFLRSRLGSDTVSMMRAPYGDPVVETALQTDARRGLDVLGGTPRLAELGIVDDGAHRRIVEALGSGSDSGYAVFDSLACEAWLQARPHINGRGG